MKIMLHTKKRKVNVKLITLKTKLTFQRGPCPLEVESEASFLSLWEKSNIREILKIQCETKVYVPFDIIRQIERRVKWNPTLFQRMSSLLFHTMTFAVYVFD